MTAEDEQQMAWNYLDLRLYIFCLLHHYFDGSLFILINVTPKQIIYLFRSKSSKTRTSNDSETITYSKQTIQIDRDNRNYPEASQSIVY